MQKKGQFFLIAALVIIAIILGLASIQIASRTSKENVVIFNLANEIDLEGKSVVDHGIFEGGTEASAVAGRIENLTRYYSDAYPNEDVTIVYTNPSNPSTYNVVNQTTVSAGKFDLGGTGQSITRAGVISTSGSCSNLPCTVQLTNNGEPLSEAVISSQGQTFYVVIAGTTSSGETTIATNNPSQKPTV